MNRLKCIKYFDGCCDIGKPCGQKCRIKHKKKQNKKQRKDKKDE